MTDRQGNSNPSNGQRPPASPASSAEGGTWEWRVPNSTLDDVVVQLLLNETPYTGISEEKGVVSVWFNTLPASATSPHLATSEPPTSEIPHSIGTYHGHLRFVAHHDWQAAFRQSLEPVVVEPITIAAPWHVAPATPTVADDGKITIVVEPGMAFGTGHHWTTTACLEALIHADLTNKHVLDVGTGTGVLALAARALGAQRVTAFDIDPEAVEIAELNVAAHKLTNITVAATTTDALVGEGTTADVVVANIITDKLLDILDDLQTLTTAGGTLICCGIGAERLTEATGRFDTNVWTYQTHVGPEWARIVAHKR